MAKIALVRRPPPDLAHGIVSHIARRAINLPLAHAQWDRYVAALQEHGWTTTEVSPAVGCPDSVFIEDTVVVYGGLAVLSHPGADARKPEVAGVEEPLRSLGYEISRIEGAATLDGGDILKVDSTVYVGRGGRTNAEGVRQLRALLEPRGATVVAVPLSRVLHLKSAVTALPDGSIIGWSQALDDPQFFPRFRPVPEEQGAHVVLLGEGALLMSSNAPSSAELFADLGYQPVPVDIGEFEKLEGCVTCLSVRLRDAPDQS